MQNQKSFAWIRDQLSCEKWFFTKKGDLMFKFTNYLVKYIHSIDPDFDHTGIDEAFYATNNLKPQSSGAFINTNRPETAFEIKRILDDKNVADMFPGLFLKLTLF